jgi:hypothetical protein
MSDESDTGSPVAERYDSEADDSRAMRTANFLSLAG